MQFLHFVCLAGTLAASLGVRAQQPLSQTSNNPANSAISHRIRVPGDVMAEQRLTYVEPAFPELARLKGIHEGTVVLHVLIGPDGRVEKASPISGFGDFQQSAVNTVRQWTYKPYLINGEPVEVETTVTVGFKQ